MAKLIVKAYSISGAQLVEASKMGGMPKMSTAKALAPKVAVPKATMPQAPSAKVSTVGAAAKAPSLAPSGFAYGSGGFKQPKPTVVKPPDTSKYAAVGGKAFADPNPMFGAWKVQRGRDVAKMAWKHQKEKLMASIQQSAQSRDAKKILMDQRRISFNNALISETT